MQEEKNKEESQPLEVEFDLTDTSTTSSSGEQIKSSYTSFSSSFIEFIQSIFQFIKEIANIKDGTNYAGTVADIKKDAEFRGHSVWILFLSILIASIGLNVNSTAVVIGAMLISPLMGPILGIGLSIGTNDWSSLKNAMRNFAIMTLVAIITSAFYFFITPLNEVQPELIARTKPTILDVLIAILGGSAGIIGVSRYDKSNIIPGVAIATALMPPLCTAGYGLATFNLHFFFGAFYLFLLNSVFIAISTVVIVRLLKFPLVDFVNKELEKKGRRYITFFVLIVMIPSGWIFIDVVNESLFKRRATEFVSENVKFEGTEIVSKNFVFTDSTKTIELFVIGELISKRIEKNLISKLPNYKLEGVKLKIIQNRDNTSAIAGQLGEKIKAGILEDLYVKNAEQLQNKDLKIQFLEDQLVAYKKDSIPFTSLKEELKIQYEDLQIFAYSKAIYNNTTTNMVDTIPTLLVRWKPDLENEILKKEERKIAKWLKVRLALDTVDVVRY